MKQTAKPSDGALSNSLQIETFYGAVIQSTDDALRVFELCCQGRLGRVRRRLRDRERQWIRLGSVFVFDEQESGIRRWTDGRIWSPSRILGNFLIYRELERKSTDPRSVQCTGSSAPSGTSLRFHFREGGLVKLTISVGVGGHLHHLICYYTKEDFCQGRISAATATEEANAQRLLAITVVPPDLLQYPGFRRPGADEIYKRSSLLDDVKAFFDENEDLDAKEKFSLPSIGRVFQGEDSRLAAGASANAFLSGGGGAGAATPSFLFSDHAGAASARRGSTLEDPLPISDLESEFGHVADTLARLSPPEHRNLFGKFALEKLAPITGDTFTGRLPPPPDPKGFCTFANSVSSRRQGPLGIIVDIGNEPLEPSFLGGGADSVNRLLATPLFPLVAQSNEGGVSSFTEDSLRSQLYSAEQRI